MKLVLAIACTTLLVSGSPKPVKNSKPAQPYDYSVQLANVTTKPGSDKYTVDQWGAPKRFI